MAVRRCRLGIDVGVTNTDACIMDGELHLLGAAKAPSTPDVAGGILQCVDEAIRQASIAPSSLEFVLIGTTHCLRALLQRRRLAKVGVIRLGLKSSARVAPFSDWPAELLDQCMGDWAVVEGGYEYDGTAVPGRTPNETHITRALQGFRKKGVESIAVSCMFSPVSPDQELMVSELARTVFGAGFPITLSHQMGSMGLLERENSAILNAALVKEAEVAWGSLGRALAERDILAPIYFTQNDGTCMSLAFARRYPILTIGSGLANSMKGAAFLTGIKDCAVIDVGGTTTSVGVLAKGYPVERAGPSYIAGVRASFSIPESVTLEIGGGSVVRIVEGRPEIAPESVGSEITSRAVAWGGDVLTLTDAAVALGWMDAPAGCDGARLREYDPGLMRRVLSLVQQRVEDALEMVSLDSHPVHLVLVGGAAPILPEHLSGAAEVLRPAHYTHANAIGAAMAEVGGRVDRLWSYMDTEREEVLRVAVGQAVERAIEAGAAPGTVRISEMEETPVGYLPNLAVRVRVRASGQPSPA